MNSNRTSISQKLRRNIYGGTFFKAIDVIFNFLLVRFAIQFFGDENYGVWLTILSFFAWFSVIEFGISSSFRNRLTQYFADGKFDKIRKWITAAYRATSIIYLSTIIIFLVVFNSFEFDFFNANEAGFGLIFQISFVVYMLHFIFFFLQTTLLATHHTNLTYIITAAQKGILLVGILLFIQFDFDPSLGFICLWFSSIPLLVWAVASSISYRTLLSDFRPKLKVILAKNSKPLRHLNKSFFIIQIATLIIYSTDNLIILSRLTGADVTNYNITFKYFNILIILFNIVLLPYWSSFTEAAHRNDAKWIKHHIKRLIQFWLVIALLAVLMLFVANYAYELWIGKAIEISFELSLFMGVSVLLTCWNNIFTFFLNSIAKTNIQMGLLVLAALVNIPLSFFLLDEFGLYGVILSSVFCLLPLTIVLPFQYRTILNHKTLDK